MIARLIPLAATLVLAATGLANAQTTTQPQTPPNAGAAEAKPTTVSGPGGYTTLPASGSQAAPTPYGPDPNSGNAFTATNAVGPQKAIGKALNQTVHYIVGDYLVPPRVFNAYSPGNDGVPYRSYDGRAVFEIPLGSYDIYVGGEGRKFTYPAGGGVVSLPGGGSGFLPAQTAIDYDEDVRVGLKVIGPRVYGAVSYLRRGGTLQPTQYGIGYGLEKLADVDRNFSLHGSAFYYPNVGGQYAGTGADAQSYRVLRYLAGISIAPNHAVVFLDAGYLADKSSARTGVPIGFNHQGPYAGLGIHF